MSEKTTKFIGWLLVILIVFDISLFGSLKINLALIFLLITILLLFLTLRLLLLKIRRLEKQNGGLSHVLEKSETDRVALEELKNQILLMVDDLPEGLLVVNKDDKVALINRSAERFLGVNRRQILNKPVLDLKHLSSVKKIVMPLVFNFKHAHKGIVEVDDKFVLELTVDPVVLGKNNIVKTIILYDITKIKRAEAVKKQFISVTAHQLKAPLSSTRLSLKMLLNKDFGKISKEQKDILEKTYKNNESLIYLVEKLLEEARVNDADKIDNRAYISLEDSVLSVIDFYKDEIKRKKIDFTFNKPAGKVPYVFADQEKIKMIVQNLFDNAVKYTPIEGKIEAGIIEKNGEMEFSIKDSGVGIPESQKGKIFTRFSNVTNAIAGGSGLGLFIAKEIIEKQQGKIWFESKENEGSIFFFTLPIAK